MSSGCSLRCHATAELLQCSTAIRRRSPGSVVSVVIASSHKGWSISGRLAGLPTFTIITESTPMRSFMLPRQSASGEWCDISGHCPRDHKVLARTPRRTFRARKSYGTTILTRSALCRSKGWSNLLEAKGREETHACISQGHHHLRYHRIGPYPYHVAISADHT